MDINFRNQMTDKDIDEKDDSSLSIKISINRFKREKRNNKLHM